MHRRLLVAVLAVCLGALVVVVAAACSSAGTSGGTAGTGMMGGGASTGTQRGGSGSAPGSGMMGGGSGASSYSSAGQRIWLTGVGSDGREIARSAPRVSLGALMMGGGGCGSCHGANGRGGTIRMMTGTAIVAPDVTYAALIKAGFTDATIRKAVRDGLDESGKPLKDAMPRWQMSDTDLDATIAYLKVLGS